MHSDVQLIWISFTSYHYILVQSVFPLLSCVLLLPGWMQLHWDVPTVQGGGGALSGVCNVNNTISHVTGI